jgi:tetratricopeptide (TPR) repeat protein
MGPTRKRVLAYGFSTLLVGGLTYVGFFYEAEADPITLLSSVDIQIRLASVMPETNREGAPLETRVRMLREVRSNLDRVEAQLPNFAPAREYRAFLTFLDGDHLAAAGHYRALRGMDECTEDLWDSSIFNEVRMLRLAGEPERALEVLMAHTNGLQESNRGTADLHQARLLGSLGRTDSAVELAIRIGRRGAEDPTAALEAGRLLEGLERIEEADAAYRAASPGKPAANYYRARLKIRIGDVDRGMRLLELAVSATPSEVHNWVARDSKDWEAVAGTKRFRDLVGAEGPASAPRR